MKKALRGLLCLALLISVSIGSTTLVHAQQMLPIPEPPVYVTESIEDRPFFAARAQYYVVNANNVRFRRTPGLSGVIIGHVHIGTVVVSFSSSTPPRFVDGIWWSSVGLVNADGSYGTSGWIASQFLDWAG